MSKTENSNTFKNEKGRPTKYDPVFIDKVDEYLSIKQDEEYQVTTFAGQNGDKVENKIRVKLPTIEGFALFIGCNKTTLYEWEKEHVDFSNALEKIRQEQKERLLDKGLSGEYNSTIAKLVLSANHGMSEKNIVEQNTTLSAEVKVSNEQAMATVKEFEEKLKQDILKKK